MYSLVFLPNSQLFLPCFVNIFGWNSFEIQNKDRAVDKKKYVMVSF